MTGLGIWWIGRGAEDTALVEEVRRRAESVFETSVAIVIDPERPGTTGFDDARGQVLSAALLDWLEPRREGRARRLLGVTDVDLFMPVLTYVYGEARLHGHVAVVSTARMTAGVPAPPGLATARAVKEAVHEVGHTFGLLHCADPRCVMARSAGLRQVDAKTFRLCPDCRTHLDGTRDDR